VPLVEIRRVDGTSVVALERWLDRGLSHEARLEVDPASASVVYGGPHDVVATLREEVDAALALRLTEDGGLTVCAGAGPPATLGRASSVRLNFPAPCSLATMAKFFCDLGRVPLIIPDYAALGADTVSLADLGDLTPADAWVVFETALAVRGWSLDPVDQQMRLVRGTPMVPSSAEARVGVLEVPGQAKPVARKLAGPKLLAEAVDGGRVVVGGADDVVRAALTLGP
jgi:hypothetical protein